MAARRDPESIPTPVLAAAAALLAFAIGAAAFGRHAAHDVPAPSTGKPARALLFVDLDGGRVQVRDAVSGVALAVLEPGEGGFVRSTLRSLVRERRRQGVGDGPPFEVSIPGPGQVLLADPATGRRVPLEAFGPTNAAAFARFIGEPEGPPKEASWKAR